MKSCSVRTSATPGIFTSVRWPRAQSPKRADVLALLDGLLDWPKLEGLVRPHYKADERKRGRKGYGLRMMVRTAVVQQLWQLSDEGTQAAILDSYATAVFIGTDPWAPRPPSAAAIRNFRNLLVNTKLAEPFRLAIETRFTEEGLIFQRGFIREPIVRKNSRAEPSPRGGDLTPA